MTRRRVFGLLAAVSITLAAVPPLAAQGPPINTDTPIMLGLQGRGVRTFVKFVRKATLLQDGQEVPDAQEQRVTARVLPVVVPYNLLSDRFQVGVILPFVGVTMNSAGGDRSSSGLGDMRVFVKALVVQRDRRNETFRVAAKAGVKLPTGDENKSPALGTGSTDYFVSAVGAWIKDRVGLYLEGIFNLNTSRDQVDFGNSVAYNFALGYRLLPAVYETYPSPQLNAFLEVNGVTTARNRVSGVTNANSGGTTVFLAPGLQYVGGRRWLVEASLQIPVINQPNGRQLATDWTVSVGTRVLLF